MTDPNTTTTDVAVRPSNDVNDSIAQLKSGQSALFSTIALTDPASRKAVLTAVMSSEPIADNLNKALSVVNIIVQPATMLNERTGEYETVPRVIFIDDKGKAYHAISGPLFRDVQNVLAIYGEPKDWEDGKLAVKVLREGTGNGRYFTLKLA